MSETASPGQILILLDDSPGSQAAARIATEIARSLRYPLAILGVSGERDADAAIAAAVSDAQKGAREKVASVEAIQATGEILTVARRRVSETPTALVVLGSNPRLEHWRQRVAARVWRMVNSLSPPVLVVPAGSEGMDRILFCTGGERFIEDGARFAAKIAAALAATVTVFHVSPHVPAMYGGRLEREEESPEEFLGSNSRLARNIRRQIEIFRSAGAVTDFHVSGGDIVPAVLDEIGRTGADLVVVGSASTRGAIGTYVLGDFAREIAGSSGKPFLVLRSRLPGFWSELRRALTEGAAEQGKSPAPS